MSRIGQTVAQEQLHALGTVQRRQLDEQSVDGRSCPETDVAPWGRPDYNAKCLQSRAAGPNERQVYAITNRCTERRMVR